MDPRLLRIVYTVEFLIALVAVFIVWSSVGGQNHLDAMPWYWKLFLGGASGLACVKLTAAAVNYDRPWNFQTIKWSVWLLALLLACGAITYYYHLAEQGDEDEQPLQSAAELKHSINV